MTDKGRQITQKDNCKIAAFNIAAKDVFLLQNLYARVTGHFAMAFTLNLLIRIFHRKLHSSCSMALPALVCTIPYLFFG